MCWDECRDLWWHSNQTALAPNHKHSSVGCISVSSADLKTATPLQFVQEVDTFHQQFKQHKSPQMNFNYIPCCSFSMTLSILPGSKLWREIYCTVFPKTVFQNQTLPQKEWGTVCFALLNNLVLHGLHSHWCSLKKQKPVCYFAISWKTYWPEPKRWSEKILCISTTEMGDGRRQVPSR